MSIVMSTMAKQQSPGAIKLNAICEKLKRTSEEDGAEDDYMNEFELAGDNNNGASGVFYPDRYCSNGAASTERCTTPQSTSSMVYNEEDSNSNTEYGCYDASGETSAYVLSDDPGSPNMTDVETHGEEDTTVASGSRSECPAAGGEESSRRNKRKNFKPRNIVYQYESCEDAEAGECSGEGSTDREAVTRAKNDFFQQQMYQHQREQQRTDDMDECYDEEIPEHQEVEEEEDKEQQRSHEQPLDLSGDPISATDSTFTSKQTLLPRRLDRAGTPMDLSYRHSDCSSNSSCASSDDGHNGFAIDLSKGSAAEWMMVDKDGVPVPESSSGPSSECPSPKMSSMDESKIGLGPSSYPGTSGLRESPASSSRSALGTGDSSPNRPSPPLLPPNLTPISGPSSTSTDASTLKDYAESTMKELLSLYGLNDMAESITKNVPLDNFSSGKILETMSPRHPLTTVSPATAGMAGFRVTPPVASSSSTLPTRSTPSPSRMPPTATHHHHHHHTPTGVPPMHLYPRTSEGVYNSICNKMVDSMAKLASLPPNSIIGNPRVILPPNMTSTILTLAAMQESKFAAMAAAANNPSLAHKVSSMEHVSSKSLIKPQSSVIVSSNSLNALHPKDHLGKAGPIDYSRYVKRYSNAAECGSNYCKDLNYREHFHCMDCNSRVFVKKEEMIRHFKWHKKRDESLQHGFLRFSPMDDCSDRFHNCSHNRKQTHYHCLKESCDKVYISTSDVQMHANYHRKDSAIIQEGFQRYRATEDCGIMTCSFYGQRTTHFHCRRANCNYTFKNKADMEKHKTYHIKDEQLNKDGFKKFMKHEHCSFENCRFSRVCNHIHCIRAGCTYVLHSSGQLYSHKRKHERRENEMAYRKFKLAQSMLKTFSENHAFGLPVPIPEEGNSSESTSSSVTNAVPVIQNSLSVSTATTGSGGLVTNAAGISPLTIPAPSYNMSNHHHSFSYPPFDTQSLNQLAHFFTGGVNLANPLGLPIPLLASGGKPGESLLHPAHLGVPGATAPGADHLSAIDLTSELLKPKPDDSWKRYLTRYTANDPCKPNCDFLYKDHYHCTAESCTMMFRSKDGVREHARSHEQQDQVTEAFFTTVEAGQTNQCPADCVYQSQEKHYHCCWENCREIILPSDKAFRRLDHYKMHDYSRKSHVGKDHLNMTLATSLEGMFKRKRGRPPKNRIIEFPVTSGHSDLPQAIFTSFKLPKPSPSLGLSTSIPSTLASALPDTPITAVATPFGFFPAALLPRPILTTPPASTIATPSLSAPLMAHAISPIEPKVEVQEGFYIFPKNTSCPDQLCLYSRQLHYHCTQPRCFYVTNRIDILTLHSRDFHGNVEILADFAYYDRDVDCRLSSCTSNRVNRHYHCTKPNCNFSFVRYSMMAIHDQTHRESKPDSPTTTLPSSPPPPTLPPLRPIIPSQSPSRSDSLSPPALLESAVAAKNTVVKATGTFYPLSAFPQHNQKRRVSSESSNQSCSDDVSAFGGELSSPCTEAAQSLNRLLMLPLAGMSQSLDWNSLIESHVQFDQLHPCKQPFCKLKKIEHYHCSICNQALSGFPRLQSHIHKHTIPSSPASSLHGGGSSDQAMAQDEDQHDRNDDDSDDLPEDEIGDDVDNVRQRLNIPPAATDAMKGLTASAFASAISENPSIYFSPAAQALAGYPSLLTHPQAIASMDDRMTSPHHNGNNETVNSEHSFLESSSYLNSTSASPSHEESFDSTPNSPLWLCASRKRNSSPRNEDFMSAEAKRCRVSAASLASLRILKDEPVPEGYIRYRFNEDCRYQHCGYREHQTHFHCIRRDCGYSFCDKTRFVQHTARHERLDTLMGGDFQQFRANVACGRPDCLYTITMASAPGTPGNKASHFHCLKCEFVCTDTNKVVAHRRQHQKLDSIMAAGFEKFTPTQNCNMEGCTHNQKQTHYHCMKCQYAVLGLSQMSAHKYRHLE